MNKFDTIVKSTLVYSVGNLGSKILSFLLVPLYSFFLTKSDLGYYDILLTTLTLLVPLVSVQISEATYRWLMDVKLSHDEHYRRVISTSFYILVMGLITWTIALHFAFIFISFKYQTLFVLLVLVTTTLQYLQQVARGLKKTRSYSASGLLYTLLLLLFNGVLLYSCDDKLFGVLIATILANLICVLYLGFSSGIGNYFRLSCWSSVDARMMVAYSWPLIPNAVSWWMISLANKYLIIWFIGVDANGIFAISNRFPAIILIINTVFMLALQDFILLDTSKQKDYSKFFNTFLRIELSLTLVLISMSRLMTLGLISHSFYESWRYMPVLFLSVGVSAVASFLGNGYIETKQTKNIFYTTLVGGVINIGFTLLLIKYIGLYAASFGTLLGFLVITLIRYRQMNFYFKIHPEYKIMSLFLISTFTCSTLLFLERLFIDLLLIIGSILLAIAVNRKIVLLALNKILKNR